MFTGPEIRDVLLELQVSHVVWLPDSTLGRWDDSLAAAFASRLLRICREGEAWPLAAGLELAGQRPVVVMQSTGLFESGDALRNVVFDLHLPVFGIIGLRNWIGSTHDSARRLALPIISAWQIPYTLVERPSQKSRLAQHYRRCQQQRQAGLALIAEEGS